MLLEGVQKTLGIVEKRTTVPILNNVLIKAGEGRIRLAATSREISLISDYEAAVMSPGEITISARKLFEMIHEVQGDVLHLDVNEANWIHITCGKTVFRLPGISADDFPKIDENEEVAFFKIKGSILRDIIGKTFYAMSMEETRVNLNGTLLETEVTDGKTFLKMVATDGHRLSLATANTGKEEFLSLEKGVIIPRKGISEIRKIIELDEEEIEIGTRKVVFIFRKGNVVLKVNLIDSDYPDYRKVLELDQGTPISLDREQLLRCLKRMSVISSEKFAGVKIKTQGSKFFLNSSNPDVGEASDELDISPAEKELEAGYNVQYLIEAIESVDEKTVILEIREGQRPGAVRPAEGNGYLCVIMPLKI